MSARTEGIHNGTWCAVCETPFKPGERRRPVPDTSERVHPCCWDMDNDCHHETATQPAGGAR